MSFEKKEKTTCISDSTTDSDNTILNEISSLDDNNDYILVNPKKYTVITSDNIKFSLSEKEIILSKLLSIAIDNNSENKNEDIPLPNVDSSTFSTILIYMKYHSINPIPEQNLSDKLISCSFNENVKCLWDVNFIENTVMGNPQTAKENLYSLVKASNYMDIQPLLNLATIKIASMIKGKSLDSIKDIISTEKPYVKDL